MASRTQELDVFVREALAHGSKRTEVEQVLLQAGWSPHQARSALEAFADVPFPVPVPRPRSGVSAAEAFQYLVLFTTLYLTAYHLGALLFHLIEQALPDPAERSRTLWSMSNMRWSSASLIIAFPVFLFVARHINTAVAADPIKRNSPVRLWLTYLTLFVAACILIGDLTTLVYSLLGGELTTRFLLKVAVVATIAGTVFGYFLRDVQKEEPR